jgi:transcription termination factor NusB
MQYNRSELRKIIMTILYQISMYEKNKLSYNVDEVIKENIEISNDFVKDVVYGVINNLNAIDEVVNKYLIMTIYMNYNK